MGSLHSHHTPAPPPGTQPRSANPALAEHTPATRSSCESVYPHPAIVEPAAQLTRIPGSAVSCGRPAVVLAKLTAAGVVPPRAFTAAHSPPSWEASEAASGIARTLASSETTVVPPTLCAVV